MRSYRFDFGSSTENGNEKVRRNYVFVMAAS